MSEQTVIPEVWQTHYTTCGHVTHGGNHPAGTRVRIGGYLDVGGLCPKCSEAKRDPAEALRAIPPNKRWQGPPEGPAFSSRPAKRRAR